jgi:molybdopterin converting factor small subunit
MSVISEIMMMKIKTRLFATLRNNRGKEVDVEVGDGATVRDILDVLSIKREDVALLLVNGRDGSIDAVLTETDYVSLFPPVGGG